jgi:enterochelin esterase family protein
MALELPLAAEQSKDKAELLPSYNPNSLGDGMTTEAQGRYFVTSAVGVQVFDTFGRHSGTLALPKAGAKIVSVEFAGADHDILFLAAGDTIWSRKLKVKGLW